MLSGLSISGGKWGRESRLWKGEGCVSLVSSMFKSGVYVCAFLSVCVCASLIRSIHTVQPAAPLDPDDDDNETTTFIIIESKSRKFLSVYSSFSVSPTDVLVSQQIVRTGTLSLSVCVCWLSRQ